MDRHVFLPAPYLAGLLLAAVTAAVLFTIPYETALEILAVIMVLIGSVYFGFAFREESLSALLIESITAVLFVLCGLLGLWISPWWLFVGLFLHGFWDLLHKRPSPRLATIPSWYIPLCLVYDWLAALIVILIILPGA